MREHTFRAQRKVKHNRYHDDNDNSFITTEPYHNGKVIPLKMVSGSVYYHVKYSKLYVFLFFDNGIPKFADDEGFFYENLNDYYRIINATSSQTEMFWDELHKNGYQLRHNKIVNIKK